jgi:hypothetical protein
VPVEFDPVENLPLTLSFARSPLFIRPLSAEDLRQIEAKFPGYLDKGGVHFKSAPAYVDAVMAEAVVDADGKPVWPDGKAVGALPKPRHEELVGKVGAYFWGDSEKNSPPASG